MILYIGYFLWINIEHLNYIYKTLTFFKKKPWIYYSLQILIEHNLSCFTTKAATDIYENKINVYTQSLIHINIYVYIYMYLYNVKNQLPKLSNILEWQIVVGIRSNLKTSLAQRLIYFLYCGKCSVGTLYGIINIRKRLYIAYNIYVLVQQPLKIIIDLQVRLMRIHY